MSFLTTKGTKNGSILYICSYSILWVPFVLVETMIEDNIYQWFVDGIVQEHELLCESIATLVLVQDISQFFKVREIYMSDFLKYVISFTRGEATLSPWKRSLATRGSLRHDAYDFATTKCIYIVKSLQVNSSFSSWLENYSHFYNTGSTYKSIVPGIFLWKGWDDLHCCCHL